jgi:hypothetical protein
MLLGLVHLVIAGRDRGGRATRLPLAAFSGAEAGYLRVTLAA